MSGPVGAGAAGARWAARDSRRHLLVAVHDVTPAHQASLQRIYQLLERLGIARYALLVVPDWHGRWPLDRHAAFVDDLLRRQAAGVEIFLHGYRHDEEGYRRSWVQRLAIAGRTASQAEFRVIPPGEARRRLDSGLVLFQRLGIDPVGFVPPAWLFWRGWRAALVERGLDLTEGFWAIGRPSGGQRRWAPALSWSTARAWRSRLTALLARARTAIERPRSLVRVAIHPPDIERPVVQHSLREALEALASQRQPVSYRSALDLE